MSVRNSSRQIKNVSIFGYRYSGIVEGKAIYLVLSLPGLLLLVAWELKFMPELTTNAGLWFTVEYLCQCEYSLRHNSQEKGGEIRMKLWPAY